MTKKSKTEELTDLLGNLGTYPPDIEASAIISADGFIIASVLPEDAKKDRTAIISAVMLSLGKRAAQELERGGLSEVYIRGKSGYVVIMASGNAAILTALARQDADLVSVFSGMRMTVTKMTEILYA